MQKKDLVRVIILGLYSDNEACATFRGEERKPKMSKVLRAFFLGIREFRCPFATKIDTFAELDAYECGVDGMHRLTLGRFR